MCLTMEEHWYVVYTRPRWEKKLASVLTGKGITNYCPLNRVMKQWSDRKKVVEEPLFKGYLFVRVSESVKWKLKSVDGILNYVYWLGKPAVVKEDDIHKIRLFLQEFDNVEVSKALEVNAQVVVRQGIMMDYKGIVLEVQGNKAKVLIDSMGLMLTAFFDRKNLHVTNY